MPDRIRRVIPWPRRSGRCILLAAIGAAAGALSVGLAPSDALARQHDAAERQAPAPAGGERLAQRGAEKAEAKSRRGRRGGGRGRLALVKVDEIRRLPLTQTVPVLGRMVPRQAGVVAARISGPVGRVAVQVGDRVGKGDVLAVLVSESLRWQRELRAGEVAQYRAALSSARAKYAKAQDELRRIRDLRKSAAFSQARYQDQVREVENLQGEMLKAKAQLRQARASLKLAEIDLDNAVIRAPYPGVVTERHTVAGAYLNVGAPVVTLVNDEDLEIEADVPSTRLGGISPGVVLNVELEDKSSHKAIVRAVVPDENPLARTRAVRLTPNFAPNGGIIAANQTVVLQVPIGAPREVLSVHKDAVLQRGGGPAVFVVADGTAVLRQVRIGDAVGGRFEVLSGVKAGELAVVRGNERLRPGQGVRVRGGGE